MSPTSQGSVGMYPRLANSINKAGTRPSSVTHAARSIYRRQTVSGREERKWLSEGEAIQGLPVSAELASWSAAHIQPALAAAVHVLGTL